MAFEITTTGFCLGVLRGSAPGELLAIHPAVLGGGGESWWGRGDAEVLPEYRQGAPSVALAVPVSRD